jgi:hypothetical protein
MGVSVTHYLIDQYCREFNSAAPYRYARVTTAASGEQKPGFYNLIWNRQDTNGRSCACGVYSCTLNADSKRFSRKVILTD